MDNRRRAERQSAIWIGSCHVEGEPSDLWRDCGIFDASKLGAGMDVRLHHPDSSDLVGRRIAVRLQLGDSTDITLTGEVKNVKDGPDGIVRAGIEFVDLSDIERTIVGLLDSGAVVKPRG